MSLTQGPPVVCVWSSYALLSQQSQPCPGPWGFLCPVLSIWRLLLVPWGCVSAKSISHFLPGALFPPVDTVLHPHSSHCALRRHSTEAHACTCVHMRAHVCNDTGALLDPVRVLTDQEQSVWRSRKTGTLAQGSPAKPGHLSLGEEPVTVSPMTTGKKMAKIM